MTKKHQNKSSIFKQFAHYGVHIWAILIVSNAALAYAFHFSTQASNQPVRVQQEAVDEPTGEPEDDTQVPAADTTRPAKPLGGTISLTFQIPGIGSGSAVMLPKRLERNVTFFLYAPDANSLNKAVKPLYSIRTTARYDTNTLSSTYTSYVITDLDLGPDVKEGKYQIMFRTDESMRTLIKESADNVGGQLFDVRKNGKIRKIPIQTVLMGDTLPKEGDNTVDISDYNAFINCFGEKNSTDFCTGSNYGDFDDNGVIDGVDYNLLLRSYGAILEQGQTIPRITAAPSNGPQRVTRLSNLPSPTEVKKKPSPTKISEEKPAAKASGSSNIVGGILFFFFLIITAAVLFILMKTNPALRGKVLSILHMSPATPPPPVDPNAPAGDAQEAPADPNAVPPTDETAPADPAVSTTDQPAAPDAVTPEVPAPDTSADPTAVAASTEIPVTAPAEAAPTEPAAPDAAEVAASTEIPVGQAAQPTTDTGTTTAPTAGETVQKDCYVKKIGPDDAGTGVWLRLTDDNGALEAHYTKTDVADGFAKVKGVMKSENGKNFLEISELVAEG